MEIDNIKEVAKKIGKEEFPESGTFITKPKIIRAKKVIVDQERIIDINGEELIGVYGDWHCWDRDGHEFFKDKRSFRDMYTAYDMDAFKIVEHEGYKVLLTLNKILNIGQDEK